MICSTSRFSSTPQKLVDVATPGLQVRGTQRATRRGSPHEIMATTCSVASPRRVGGADGARARRCVRDRRDHPHARRVDPREYAGVADIVDELTRRHRTGFLSNTNMRTGPLPSSPDYRASRARFASRFAFVGCAKQTRPRPTSSARRAASRRGPFFDDIAVNVDAARAYGWNAERIDPATGPRRNQGPSSHYGVLDASIFHQETLFGINKSSR